jgi:hypothetical protein
MASSFQIADHTTSGMRRENLTVIRAERRRGAGGH